MPTDELSEEQNVDIQNFLKDSEEAPNYGQIYSENNSFIISISE